MVVRFGGAPLDVAKARHQLRALVGEIKIQTEDWQIVAEACETQTALQPSAAGPKYVW